MRSTILQATFTLLVLTANGCSNPGQPTYPDPSANPYLAFAVNATDQAIVWESTDSSVASVDAMGRVVAKAVGSGVFITAYTHDGHYQSSANVTVDP